MSFRRRWSPTISSQIASGTPASSGALSVAARPGPPWFFRFIYDRESAAWERGRDEPEQRELVERTADELALASAPITDHLPTLTQADTTQRGRHQARQVQEKHKKTVQLR
jgi:hypothetical protein